jgi:hypothetical protein
MTKRWFDVSYLNSKIHHPEILAPSSQKSSIKKTLKYLANKYYI